MNPSLSSHAAQTLNSSKPEILFREGISLTFSRWTAFQMAIDNQWGGRDSLRKSLDLASAVFSFFSQPKDQLFIDDLENLLYEVENSLNLELDDGSIEEVAEQLMEMHEDCLQGNYERIEKLRMSVPGRNAIAQSKRVINDDEDDSSDEEASDMMLDEPAIPEMAVEKKPSPKLEEMPDNGGWMVVTPKKNKGKRPG